MKNGIKNAVIVTLAGGIVALTAECIEQHHEINRKRNLIKKQRERINDLRDSEEFLTEELENMRDKQKYLNNRLHNLINQNMDALKGTTVINRKNS